MTDTTKPSSPEPAVVRGWAIKTSDGKLAMHAFSRHEEIVQNAVFHLPSTSGLTVVAVEIRELAAEEKPTP